MENTIFIILHNHHHHQTFIAIATSPRPRTAPTPRHFYFLLHSPPSPASRPLSREGPLPPPLQGFIAVWMLSGCVSALSPSCLMHTSIHGWQRSSPQGLCRPAPCTRNLLSNLRSYFRFAKRKENSESPHGAVWPADRPPPINNQLLIRSLDFWGLNSSSGSAASLASRRPRPSVALRPQSVKILLCPFCGDPGLAPPGPRFSLSQKADPRVTSSRFSPSQKHPRACGAP
jgi:hypothetical protein